MPVVVSSKVEKRWGSSRLSSPSEGTLKFADPAVGLNVNVVLRVQPSWTIFKSRLVEHGWKT